MEVTFFRTPGEWRKWLEKNHEKETEVLVGFFKKDSGKPSITWPESVDGALCFGWIDGVRRRIDDSSYCIRFTPRKKTSIWSAVNIARVAELTAQRLMHPAGLQAFGAREEKRSRVYAFEQKNTALTSQQEQRFKVNSAAWDFFQSQPPGYRRLATWWVISAKKEDTQHRRLATLIDDSAHGRRLRQVTLETKH